MESTPTTLVLACFQSGHILKQTLVENLKSGFEKIIIVDGESSDGTGDIVKEMARAHPGRIEFYAHPKKGLANARNMGSIRSKSPLTMHAGPDNIIPKSTLDTMIDLVGTHDLVSCRTRTVNKGSGYVEQAHQIYKNRFQPGPQQVVGTPYMAKTELFKQFPFNETMLNSDDTELCERLVRKGKTLYRSQALCLETGFNDLPQIIERWMRWGRGDALFYRVSRRSWTLPRKIRSWLHPLKAEWMDSWRALTMTEFLFCLPFLWFTMTLRYLGWLRYRVLKK